MEALVAVMGVSVSIVAGTSQRRRRGKGEVRMKKKVSREKWEREVFVKHNQEEHKDEEEKKEEEE